MKSEMKMPQYRDREVKWQQNSREFSRNETLAGYCCGANNGILMHILNVASFNLSFELMDL